MPSNAFTSAGTLLGVENALPASYDQAGYEALSYDGVGEVVSMGEYGRVYEKVEHKPLGTRETIKRKGSYDEGALTLQLALDPDDTGQTTLKTARDSDTSVSLKVTLQNGDAQYFTAQVMSYTTNVGSSNQITGASCVLEIDSTPVDVPAP